jgi:hypothetical protein
MNEVIVDTNIILIANEQNDKVAYFCYRACVKFLLENENSRVVVDFERNIRREYANKIILDKPRGIGARFYIKLLQYHPDKVRQVELNNIDDDYPDFPKAASLEKFDRSDRKFAALSVKTGISVSAATDRGWVDFSDALFENGVKLNLICGCDKSAWFNP